MTSILDAEQEREDLLSIPRMAHHQAWCAVNEEWINEPQQLESMLFVATNVLDRIEKLIDRLCGAPLAERVAALKASLAEGGARPTPIKNNPPAHPRRDFYDCDFRALRQVDVCSDRFAG